MKWSFQMSVFALFFANVVCASEKSIGENYRFVGDNRAMEICAAALRSETSIATEARRLHITRKALKNVTCNGQSPTDFSNTNRFLGSKTIASAE
tara:strand:- start:366 stop:650 length:285 start_codon:yes stop_codon:yes gene_type:complete